MSAILCSLGVCVCSGVCFVVQPVRIVRGTNVCVYRPAKRRDRNCWGQNSVFVCSASCFFGAVPVAGEALACSVLLTRYATTLNPKAGLVLQR